MNMNIMGLGLGLLCGVGGWGLAGSPPSAGPIGRHAYRCGALAAWEVGQVLQPDNARLAALLRWEVLPPGLSMLEVARASGVLGLDLVPAQVDEAHRLPLPAVALLHRQHYVAVFAGDGDLCRVYDPVGRSARTVSRQAVWEACQGCVLVARSQMGAGMRVLPEAVSAVRRGGATGEGVLFDEVSEGDCPNDTFRNMPKCPEDLCDECEAGTQEDGECANCQSASPADSARQAQAMPVWRVTQPVINLWILDTPLFYTTSHDDWMTFRLVYKQRNGHHNTNVFGVGRGWECNWRSYNIPDGVVPGNIRRLSGSGGQYSYVPNGQTREFHSRGKLSTLGGGGGYELRGPRGGTVRHDIQFTDGVDLLHHFPSQRVDPQGRTNRLEYLQTNGLMLLTRLIDSDGQTNTLYYTNTAFPYLITKVKDPYDRTVLLAYDHQGRLTNLTDMIGLSTGFAYDSSGLITSMRTPYGTTLFSCTTNEPPTSWDNSGYANVVNRSVRVVEPNGATHLYAYRHSSDQLNPTNATPLLPDSYPSGQVPVTDPLPNTFNNVNLSQRNSFYWGPRQYALLNTSFRANPTNFSLLTTNDYRYAQIKHWLWEGVEGTVARVSRSLSLIRFSSPDGTNDGPKVWFDYDGKQYTHNQGTNSLPRLVARVLPDGTSSFRYLERSNTWENPTRIIQSWSSNSATVLLRTNTITYDDDGIRVTGIHALRGANQELVAGFGDYYDNLPRRITNAALEVTVLSYDATNRQILNIVRPSGLITTNRYYTSGSFKGWLEWTADYAVEGGTNVLFGTNAFTYLKGLARTATDTRGHTVTLTWDDLERLTQATFTNGSYSFAYCLLDLTNRVDRLGHSETFGHDSMRRLIWRRDARDHFTYFEYCTCGSLESIADAANRFTYFLYDAAGRLTNTIHPGDLQYAFGYDAAGRLTEVIDGHGHTTTRFFNNQGLITAVSNQVGLVYAITPNIDDLPARVTTAEGVTVTNTFDALGRILTRQAPDGGQESFAYNVRGLTNWTDPLEKGLRLTVDAAGRPVRRERVNAAGTALETLRFEYGRAGDLLKFWDGADHLTQWTYDTLGRARTKVNASNITEFTWSYDAEDRLTARTDALNRTTSYGYDAAGNLTNVTYAGTNTANLAMTYDALNRLETLVDGVGTTAFSYAANGRLALEDGPWADDTVSYLYNVVGLRQRVSVPRGGAPWSADYAYDAARRLTNLVSGAGSFTNQFLAGVGGFAGAGRLLEKVKFPGGTVATNRFDPVGRLLETTLRRAGGTLLEQWQYGYEVDGLMKGATNGFGTKWSYTHDALSQLKTAAAKTSGGTSRLHEQLTYSYDAAGNLSSRVGNDLTQNFGTDPLNQLTTVTRSGTLTVAGTTGSTATNVTVNGQTASLYPDATFAKAGFTLTNGNNTFTAIGQDSLGRKSTNTVTVNLPSTVTFTYDAKGNLTSDGQRGFTYDDENQLVGVQAANSWKAGFAYDGFGRRREKTESTWGGSAWVTNLVVRYVYDGMLVLQERHFNPAVSMQTPVEVVTYTRGLDLSGSLQGAGGIGGLLARTDSKGTVYYQTDGRGNVTALFNASGGVVARYAYDPFGNTLAASGPMAEANVYRFSSKEIHPGSGLYYYGFRFYDPNLQRWLNRDPIGESGGINLHQFVINNPLILVDLYGLEPPFAGAWRWWSDFADEGGRALYGALAGLDPTGFLPIDPDDPNMAGGKALGETAGMCLPGTQGKRALDAAKKGKSMLNKLGICEDLCASASGTRKIGRFLKGEEVAEAAAHAREVGKVTGVVDRAGKANRRAERMKGLEKVPCKDLDEYPPAVIKPDDPTKVSVKPINRSQNRRSGARLRNELPPDGTPIEIDP